MRVSSSIETRQPQLLSQRTIERVTALLLVLYCVAQAVTIVTRIASATDQPDTIDSILNLSANHSWYLASKIANLAAAFLLVALSALLYRVFAAYDRALAMLSAAMFFTAGILWLVSSLAGLALAEIYSEPVTETAALAASPQTSPYLAIEPVRAMAGRVGFTAVALALAPLGTVIALARPMPRWIGWAGWPIALAMFFIWDPDATEMHRLGGSALLVWFLVVAGFLSWKGTANATPNNEHIVEGDD